MIADAQPRFGIFGEPIRASTLEPRKQAGLQGEPFHDWVYQRRGTSDLATENHGQHRPRVRTYVVVRKADSTVSAPTSGAWHAKFSHTYVVTDRIAVLSASNGSNLSSRRSADGAFRATTLLG